MLVVSSGIDAIAFESVFRSFPRLLTTGVFLCCFLRFADLVTDSGDLLMTYDSVFDP